MKMISRLLVLISISMYFNTSGIAQEIGKPKELKDSVLAYVEQMPEYPGGMDSMYAFFSKHLNYPMAAREKGKEGKCMISFVVCADGNICNIEANGKKIGYGLEEEAIRVVSAMPKWTPGYQNGKPVFVRYTLPVKYKLN